MFFIGEQSGIMHSCVINELSGLKLDTTDQLQVALIATYLLELATSLQEEPDAVQQGWQG